MKALLRASTGLPNVRIGLALVGSAGLLWIVGDGLSGSWYWQPTNVLVAAGGGLAAWKLEPTAPLARGAPRPEGP